MNKYIEEELIRAQLLALAIMVNAGKISTAKGMQVAEMILSDDECDSN